MNYETLWHRLKPKYKEIIENYIEGGKYTAGPQSVRMKLLKTVFWGELTIEDVRSLFLWTDSELTEVKWTDLFGDRFLIEDKK
tara:strand:- start:313 stop:561 length:249 start_codon:yes stop_codon:yes gene_type:complete